MLRKFCKSCSIGIDFTNDLFYTYNHTCKTTVPHRGKSTVCVLKPYHKILTLSQKSPGLNVSGVQVF